MDSVSSTRECEAGAALPPALTAVIERVIRGTRLWPSEKRDVRAELESHFREGLIELADEGLPLDASIQVLCESFGNPDMAARLIRRGKKRGRPMLWKIAISITGTIVGLLAAGGGYAAYLKYGKPNPSVDYLAELNEPTELISEAQRAWPSLRAAILAFEPMPQALTDANGAAMRPGDEQWPEVQEWLAKNRPLMAELRDAASKPYYGFIYGGDDTTEFLKALAIRNRTGDIAQSIAENEADPLAPRLISILLPHLAEIRGVSRFLVLNARDHAANGQWESAWESLELCHRLGITMFQGKTLIEQLMGVAVVRLAQNELVEMLGERQGLLSKSELEQLAQSQFATLDLSVLTPHYEGERLMFSDIVQYVFTDDGMGNGRLIPSQYARVMSMGTEAPSGDGLLDNLGEDATLLAMAAQHADRVDTVARYERLWTESSRYRSLPLYDSNRDMADQLVRDLSEGGDAKRFALIATLMPSMSRADQLIRECAMSCDVVRAVVALARFRSDRGEWPAVADQLVPTYLDALPVDAYSGQPIRYMLDSQGTPVLYSVGRNLTDEGGSGVEYDERGYNARGTRTTMDMVFFPAAKK